MKTNINTQKIKDLLDVSTSQLSPETLDHLRMARTLAINHQRTRQSVPVLAWIGGHHNGQNTHSLLSKPMVWLMGAIFAACLITGATYWHNYSIEHDIADVDIAILTDDMPINVFLD